VIEAKGLTMRYGPLVALRDASFRVEPGTVLGMLGPNGAGKTTCMKIVTTFLVPTAGTAVVEGHDIHKEPIEVRRRIGYLPERAPLYGDMEVCEYVDFMGRARGLSGRELRRRKEWVVERCKLAPVYRQTVSTLSLGFRQRTCLAQALIHDPPVLILDEPTSGLDPFQIVEIRGLIRELARTKTVVFSTHILQEASSVSDRILVIHRGEIVADGTIEELGRQAASFHRTEFAVAAPRDEALRAVEGIAGVRRASAEEEKEDGVVRLRVESDPGVRVVSALDELARTKKWPIRTLAERPFSLEETYIALTGRGQAGGGAGPEDRAGREEVRP